MDGKKALLKTRKRQGRAMKLHLGGHLSWYQPEKRPWLDVELAAPAMLGDVLRTLGVPLEEIAVGTVNGAAIFSFDQVRVADGDCVELYPPVGGGTRPRAKATRRAGREP